MKNLNVVQDWSGEWAIWDTDAIVKVGYAKTKNAATRKMNKLLKAK